MRLTATAILLLTATVCVAQNAGDLSLMPWPANVQRTASQLPLERGLNVRTAGRLNERLQAGIERFQSRLAARTGVHHQAQDAPVLDISFQRTLAHILQLNEDESYRLTVTPAGARLDAPTDLGVLCGLETLLQLAGPRQQGMAIPAVVIEDRPRFAWRGLMLDVSRHWIPGPAVKRTLDGMAAAKLNVLHWHLSDDQGFRVESKLYPKLHTVGGEGRFYSQEQIKDIVNYAAERGIRVVPEFDVPGHTTSWLAAYPELAAAPGEYTVGRKWGVFDPLLDPTNEHVYKFLDGLFGEMTALFPDRYFHIGGDEVNAKQWTASGKITAFRKEKGLADNHALQAYFNKRLNEIVRKHGKIMMGWDEVLHPDLPADVLIHSWRGPQSLLEAAKQGHSGLLSFGYYLDLMYPAGIHYLMDPLQLDPAAYQAAAEFFGVESGRGAAPVKQVAKFAAEMKNVDPALAKKVLGGESCMWVEFVTPDNLDQRVWPRAAAVAERLWSPATVKDVWSMYRRLDAFELHLATVGISPRATGRFLRSRLTGGETVPAVEALATAVEPPKGYFRSGTGKYTSLTPLNRLVDSVPADNDVARRFGLKVREFLNQPSAANREEVVRQLREWAAVENDLRPHATDSAILAELVPVAADVTALANIGLEAVKMLEGKQRNPDWVKEQQARLAAMTSPRAELLISFLPHVRLLVNATAK